MPLRVKCPTCHCESAWENNPHRPFCSDRCKLIDLGGWADEKYRIAGDKLEGEPDDNDDEDEEER